MIGLDTNILVRYLTQDDPVQSRRATGVIERRLTETDPGFVSVVALVELAWVLDRSYGFTSQEISAAIERLLQIDVLNVEHEQEIFIAMRLLKDGKSSFGVALIAELGRCAGCTRTLTFDHKAARLPNFELV